MNLTQLLKTPLEELTFSVVDTETTGMNPKFCKVIDIGIIKIKNGEILEEWETLINPKQSIDYWITYYTKLRDKDVKNKPTFKTFAPKINELLTDTIFVGHNAGFDYGFLTNEMIRCGFDFKHPKLCTVLLGRKLLPQLANAHLDALSAYYKIKISARHRALPDAQATAYVLNKFIGIAKEQYKAKNFFDLERLQHLKIDKTFAANSLPSLVLFSESK